MSWINVGASDPNGTRIASKAALKRLLLGGKVKGEPVAAAPSEVVLDNTAMGIGPGEATYRGDDLPAGAKFTVVGPDPYKNRKWYASVQVDGNGKITVK